jgi:translation elongation factor EF-4
MADGGVSSVAERDEVRLSRLSEISVTLPHVGKVEIPQSAFLAALKMDA